MEIPGVSPRPSVPSSPWDTLVADSLVANSPVAMIFYK